MGALANLGYNVCDQTVGNVLRRHGLSPAPERKRTTTWSAFIRIHLALLAGTDFFTAEVLTFREKSRTRTAKERVLPGAKTNAGGKGPGLRYRQPRNLSYQLPVTDAREATTLDARNMST